MIQTTANAPTAGLKSNTNPDHDIVPGGGLSRGGDPKHTEKKLQTLVSVFSQVSGLRPFRTGFGSRCEAVALPRRKLASLFLGLCPNRGAAPSFNGSLDRKGIAASSHRAAKPLRKLSAPSQPHLRPPTYCLPLTVYRFHCRSYQVKPYRRVRRV